MYVPVVAALLAVLVCCGALPEWAVGQSGPAAPAVTGVVTQASPDGALTSYCYDSRIGDVGSVLAEAPLVNVPGGRSVCGQCLWVAPNNVSLAPFLAFVVGGSCGGVVGCTGPTRMESQNSAISSIAAAVGDGATWSWAACDDAWFPAGIVIEMHPSSQLFFVQLRLLGSVNGPPVQVEIRAQGGSFAAMDSVTPWWTFNPGMALTLPLDVRVTDVLGSQLTMNGFITAFNGLFSTGQQFARGTTGTTATTTGTTATTATTASTSGTTGTTTAPPPATTGAAAATTGVVMASTGAGAAATTTGGNASSATTATTTATSSLTSATTAPPSAPASPPPSPTSSPSPAPVVANSSAGARLSGLILATAAAAALLLLRE